MKRGADSGIWGGMSNRLMISLTAAVLLLGTAAVSAERAMSFHDLQSKQLNGQPVNLSEYKGKVVLVVNTASECGYTPQYAGLEKLWGQYKDKGVVVLGIPSNDFGGQEPGSAEQIAKFCELRYKVTFPMLEKVKTKGEGQSPIYEFLARKHGEPKWNFHKYLVGKDGQVRAAFPSSVTPESAELKTAIDKALAE
ncbi:glutathione peroxidase [Archangium violaceum]|uniref:glutathione peroxidase n=1 Tax=Archangium violaceum TaxID=83451 RepID=UPI001EF05F41|nr:glutathione peroxidase [Archangium violaceum]